MGESGQTGGFGLHPLLEVIWNREDTSVPNVLFHYGKKQSSASVYIESPGSLIPAARPLTVYLINLYL